MRSIFSPRSYVSLLSATLSDQLFPGATDATHFQLTAGIPTVAAYGPGFLTRAHAPNESAPIEGIVQAAELYALAALRYVDA